MSGMPTRATALRFTAIDRAFARFVVRRLRPAATAARVIAPLPLLGQAERHEWPLMYHTALLASALQGDGHSVVDLTAHAGSTVEESDDVDAYTFPDVDAWCAALAVSGAVEVRSGALATSSAVAEALEQPPFVLEGARLYLLRYWLAECRVAAAIRTRVQQVRHDAPDAETIAMFRTLFPGADSQLDRQALAAVAAWRSALACITGGPGTGKTTVVAKVLALLCTRPPMSLPRIVLAAPTGRAAARLGEAVQQAAGTLALPPVVRDALPTAGTTLHRLLGYRPRDDRFQRTAASPIDADVVVVDEASMVDVLMMDALLAALPPRARLILLGDPGQLASVDTGFVLGDIVRATQGRSAGTGASSDAAHGAGLVAQYGALAGGVPDALTMQAAATQAAIAPLRDAVVQLHFSWRFDRQRGIGALATASRAGDAAAALAVLADEAQSDVALQPPAADTDTLLAPLRPAIEALLASTTPADALAALGRFRVLAALRDHDAGIAQLNARIERWLAAHGHDTRGVDGRGWYAHRPVLITANDPATQLFNGDVGVVLPVDGEPLVHFAGPAGVRSLRPSRLPAHETAWAMTVHKAQGSEFDEVLLVLPPADARILTRELVYTGITRARRRVTLAGTAEALSAALGRGVARTSGLSERLAAD
ncbi:MAG: exodeoxyribonuclease V subunit alpha [Gemmatimonadetes bacterium]|nr:exodeoxyribonuclease V subunit alpha [Gemmatimonadota bacterium]